MTPRLDGLIVLGRRAPVIRAALRVAERVVVVAPRLGRDLRQARALTWIEADPEEAVIADVAARVPDGSYTAVIAAGEGTVRPAAALRRRLELPGASPTVAASCTDKALMKERVRGAGLRCADWVTADEALGGDDLGARLGLPLVVKDRSGSGGRGTRVVRSSDGIPPSLSPGRMAESFLSGREMSVETLVHEGRPVWWNLTEYVAPRSINVVPAPPLAAAEGAAVRALVSAAISALEVERGLTHTEVFVDRDGPAFGELALRPPGGYIMRAVELAYDFDPWAAWIHVESGLEPVVRSVATRVAAVQVLHPGAGAVTEATGAREAAGLPGVDEAVLRVRSGTILPPRLGAGQEAGHVLVVGADRDEALRRLRAAVACIHLRVEPRTP